jgi:hypothetical protein
MRHQREMMLFDTKTNTIILPGPTAQGEFVHTRLLKTPLCQSRRDKDPPSFDDIYNLVRYDEECANKALYNQTPMPYTLWHAQFADVANDTVPKRIRPTTRKQLEPRKTKMYWKYIAITKHSQDEETTETITINESQQGEIAEDNAEDIDLTSETEETQENQPESTEPTKTMLDHMQELVDNIGPAQEEETRFSQNDYTQFYPQYTNPQQSRCYDCWYHHRYQGCHNCWTNVQHRQETTDMSEGTHREDRHQHHNWSYPQEQQTYENTWTHYYQNQPTNQFHYQSYQESYNQGIQYEQTNNQHQYYVTTQGDDVYTQQ